ncbi:dimethylaniline monooxygenase N-oxide-forming 5-like [Gigaspora margarita]|uniref:Flavin-containing monooxygenase 1 n=1 Tax=Gigaspora margarita TaxID=4874 RepID=A0A8H4B3R6_GIGMA|nr:dimethylaniline monooxygenase N-oxide-forming 5-like [Gigaspora margarita]
MVKPRIAIIGAGSSGLTALKQCLADDLDPICFEQTSCVGGLWNFVEVDDENKDPHPSSYKSLIINTSKEMMTFSDFPIPAEWPTYLHNSLVAKYFNMYADHFKLWPYIKFRTTVVHVSYLPDHRWKVKYITCEDKDQTKENPNNEHEEIFDYVIVCNGHHRKHRWPKYKGMDEFKGEQTHSHLYRRAAPFENKRVVVVGIGNSGLDIAVELSHVASQVYLCVRRGTLPWIMPRLIDGKAIDQLRSRFSDAFLPTSSSAFTKRIVQIVGPHPPSLQPTTPLFAHHPTVKSDFFERLSTGTIIVTKNILELMPDETKSIKFVDGSIVENIDAVIYATGYHIDFPFLDREIINGGPEIEQEFEDEYKENLTWMYKMIFPPNYRNIAFIGLFQPIAAIFPITELQSRYVTSLIKGVISPLPSPKDMDIAIRNYHKKNRKQYYLSARHTMELDYFEYLDKMSQELGCYPYSLEILKKFGFNLWKLVMFGVRTPIQYRLLGRQSWEGAKDAIMAYNKINPIQH